MPPEAAANYSEDQILEYLKELARQDLELKSEQVDQLSLESSISDGLQLDSLRQVILLANVEQKFGFELTLEDRQDLAGLNTVSDLVGFIRSRQARGTTFDA